MEGGHNLPNLLTSFVGRRHEVREVRRMVGDFRLLTLSGPGGAGKTRLALEVARGMTKQFADGVCLVELSPLSEARLIQPALASALEVHEQPGRPLLATLSDYLRGKRLLLLLDNCEHLVTEVASLVETFLRTSDMLHVLATSRVELGITGERTWPVPQLAAAEAAVLFAERAADVRDGFVLTRQTEAPVAEICRHLDGMPLAIELAAARLKTLSLEQIAVRLSDRFALLTGGSRTALPRQQTLAATMDWSHELLPDSARRLWRRSSVFAGGFTLEAAEAICSDDELNQTRILEQLTILVESSLLRMRDPDGAARYQMLETVREYGRLKLEEAAEADAFRRRHLEWFLGLTQRAEPEWRGRDQHQWLDRLEADIDNVRAALEHSRTQVDLVDDGLALASGSWLLWVARDHIGEGRQWLATLLERAQPSRARAYGLNAAGLLAYVQGDTAAAVALLEESLRLNEALGDRAGTNFSLLRLGIGLYYHNELDRAISVLDQALGRYRKVGDRVGIYVSGYELAEALTMRGDFDRARQLHQESLALKQQQGDVWHLGLSYFGLGLLAWREGDQPEAASWLRRSIELRAEMDDLWGLNRAVEALAWVEASRADAVKAARLMGASAAMLERSSTALSANYLGHHEQCVKRVRTSLSPAAFERSLAQGRALSAAQAVQYASHGDRMPVAISKAEGGVTRREQEIAALVARGMTNRQIAQQLHLAERTVDAHVEHIMNKLGYRSRAQIAAWAATRSN